jgi:hypothetical protein
MTGSRALLTRPLLSTVSSPPRAAAAFEPADDDGRFFRCLKNRERWREIPG